MNKFEHNLAKGNVAKELIKFALPFIISNLLQACYSMADMVIVGQFSGTVSMSGVNIGGQVNMVVVTLVFGLASAATVLIGQYMGAGDRTGMKETISTLFAFLLWFGIALTVAMVLLRNPILRLLQTPEVSFSEASSYLLVTSLGTLFIFGYNALSAVLRGMGDSKRPLYFVAIAALANVALDLLLVAVLRMGAFGAALATIASQGLSVLLCAVYLRRGGFVFDFRPKSFKISAQRLRVLLKIGIPMSVQSICASVSFLFFTAMVNIIDPSAVASAAVGAVGKFNGFGVTPSFAMSSAIAAMCAQNIGAGEWERAKKTVKSGLLISLGISGMVFLYVTFFPESIMIFFANDTALIAAGQEYLSAFSWDYLVVPLFAAFNGLFIGAGHTKFASLTGIASSLLVRIPACYLFSITLKMGLFGVGLGAPAASAASAVVCFAFYLSGKWKRSAILEQIK